MPNALITAFLCQAPDPVATAAKIGLHTRPGEVNALASASLEQLADYMRPWVETVLEIPHVRRIVLHDGLPEDLIKLYPTIEFVKVERTTNEIAWVVRFRMLYWFLTGTAETGQPEIDRLFFTDINDIGVLRDPFTWLHEAAVLADLPVLGEEWNTFGGNPWFTGKYEQFPPAMREFFETRLPLAVPVSAGLWGGGRGVVLEILDSMLKLLDEHAEQFAKYPHTAWDMMTLNYVVFTRGRFAAFKMEAIDVAHPAAGVAIRNVGQNPFTHDRDKVLAHLGPASSDAWLRRELEQRLGKHPQWPRLQELLDANRCWINSKNPIDSCAGLIDLVSRLFPQDGKIVETGRYHGVSGEVMALLCPQAEIMSVDNFPHEAGLKRLAGYPHVRLVEADAVAFAEAQPPGTVAAVYLDNDHGYEHVRRELRAWRPKMRPGGVLAGHDYCPQESGVMRAVNEVFRGPPHYVFADSSWAYVLG